MSILLRWMLLLVSLAFPTLAGTAGPDVEVYPPGPLPILRPTARKAAG